MICNNNYLADILRACEIKELIWGHAYSKSLSILNRESYMSAHIFMNLLNEMGKIDILRGLQSIYLFFGTSLINSISQEHEF